MAVNSGKAQSSMKFCRRSAGVLTLLLLAPGTVLVMNGAQVVTLQVTAEQANIREKPDIMSPVLKQLVTGAVLEAERKEGEWYAVRVDLDTGGTVIGYVHESLVRVVQGAPAETKAPPKAPKEPVPGEVKPPPAGPKPAPIPASQPPAKPAPAEPAAMRSSLSIWYGEKYAAVGDINEGAKGMADYFASELGVSRSNDVGSVHYGGAFAAEFRFPLMPSLDASVGAGYFSAKRSSSVAYSGQPSTTRYLTTPSVRNIPVSLALVYYVKPKIYVKAGLEIAFGHCEYLYRFEEGGAFREWRGTANDVGLGYVLAGGMEWRLSGPVSVLVEAGYRKTRLTDLDGEEIYSESGKTDVRTEGALYFSRREAPGGLVVPGVFISTTMPSGSGVVEARKADLSFSGLSLSVGLRYAF